MTRSSGQGLGIHPLEWLRFVQTSLPTLFDHARLTLELADLEWQQEKKRLRRVMLMIALAVISGVFFVAVVTAVIMLLTWYTPYRYVAIALLLLTYALGVGLAILRLSRLSDGESFTATRAEVARDIALFRDST